MIESDKAMILVMLDDLQKMRNDLDVMAQSLSTFQLFTEEHGRLLRNYDQLGSTMKALRRRLEQVSK